MKKKELKRAGKVNLLMQPGLEHRGGLKVGEMFPPPETFGAIGGSEGISRLVDGLYDRIEADKALRPAFLPDLTEERVKVKRFFAAWFGGSAEYFDAEWRQGLRVTHAKISISRGMAGRWVGHFLASLAEVTEDPGLVQGIKPVVSRFAMALVNRAAEPKAGERLRGTGSAKDMEVFLQAIRRDDGEGLVAAADWKPEMIERHGVPLLLVAAVRGKARAAEALLLLGVDVNAPAALSGSEAKIAGLPVLQITPLCGALAAGRDAVAELLLRQGAQYDIFSAAYLGDVEGMKTLLDLAPELANANDPACDLARIGPLMHAVFAGQYEAARLLLQRGADIGQNSVRLVGSAANRGDAALVDLLLEHGAEASSIRIGTWVLYPGIAEKLIARGADVNRVSGAWIGLCCTGNSGHKENLPLVRAMLRCGADVGARYKGLTALHCAAKAGFIQVTEALLEAGANLHALSEEGRTPLEEIAMAGRSIDREPMRRLLLSQGA